jgi:ribonuclease Z
MDTRLCDAAFALADRADMLVCESTFADAEAGLARDYGHLTAGQAGRIAAESGARLLVLTHFSQRYESTGVERLADEAAAAFGGQVVLARDLDRVDVPPRHPLTASRGSGQNLALMPSATSSGLTSISASPQMRSK